MRRLSAYALAFFLAGGAVSAAAEDDAPQMPAVAATAVESEATQPSDGALSAADILLKKHDEVTKRVDDVAAPPADDKKADEAVPAAADDKAPAAADDKAPVAAVTTTTVTVTKKIHKTGGVLLPKPRPPVPGSAAADDDDDIPIVDTDETLALPAYPPHAHVSIGAFKIYTMGEEDTLLDVARFYRLGYVELRAANPKVDPWTPVPGEDVLIPAFKLLPRAPQKGVVVNLAQMRMYYFQTPGGLPLTFPIGIGREGLLTPVGQTSIVRKQAGPSWFPTPRMREEHPYLPAAVPPGPNNPLGTHALYLGWPEYRIHGTDKPWAIGRRVSSGCMRMYPEDIKALFNMVPVGTPVTVVEQPLLVAWIGNDLYLEANPSKSQSNDIEISGEHADKGLTSGVKKVITNAAGHDTDLIDWHLAGKVVDERLGYPIVIATRKGAAQDDDKKPAQKTEKQEKPAVKEDVPVKEEKAAVEDKPAQLEDKKPEDKKPEDKTPEDKKAAVPAAPAPAAAVAPAPAPKKTGWSLESSDDAIKKKHNAE